MLTGSERVATIPYDMRFFQSLDRMVLKPGDHACPIPR
jgi:hypothetical protein